MNSPGSPVLTKNTDLLKQEVHEHIAADAVIQGSYWEGGKGCFFGCLTHCNDPAPAVERFGLTEPILRIAERIFESLPLEEAKAFFREFPDAVQCDNKDLSLVHWKFLAETLRNLPPQTPAIQAVIDPVINGMDLLASGGIWEKAARGKWAAEAAQSATDASRAAKGAAGAAWAADDDAKAAWVYGSGSTEAATRAARAAAFAAWAAGSAEAETRRQRDSLLRLIREAPVATPSLT